MPSHTLPYPPSINRYWRRSGNHIHLSNEGRAYRGLVAAAVGDCQELTGRLAVRLQIHPPDRRKRDIDNVQKAVLDGLQHAGVYVDDCQIDCLLTERMPLLPGGLAVVTVEEIGGTAA